MKKLYLLVALVLTLTSCDTLAKKRLTGTYQYTGQKSGDHFLYRFKLTGTKFVTSDFMGEHAFEYTIEDSYLYMNIAGTQYPFKIVSLDKLRNEGSTGLEGTYVRVKQ